MKPYDIVNNSIANAYKLLHFSKDAIAHFLNGNPTCSQRQIDERYSICAKCDNFVKIGNSEKYGYCNSVDAKGCGCNIKDTKVYLNLLAWADKSCPANPPKWEAVEPEEEPENSV